MRLKLIKYFLYALIIVILIQGFNLIVLQQKHYHKLLKKNTNQLVLGYSAPRGKILDIKGRVLVDNVGIKTIVYQKVSGIKSSDEQAIALKLATLINLKEDPTTADLKKWYLLKNNLKKTYNADDYRLYEERRITLEELKERQQNTITNDDLLSLSFTDQKAAKIYSLMNTGYYYMPKIIKAVKVTEEEVALINEQNLAGISTELMWERTYPYGNTLRSILGSVSSYKTGLPAELKEEYLKKGYSLNDRVGISYLEKQYEDTLLGEKAVYQILPDKSLKLITSEKPGKDLVLTIDIELQKTLDEIVQRNILLAKKQSSTKYFNHHYVIVGNPQDGSIKAISGWQLLNNQDHSFIDIASSIITASYTVGSVVKGASISVGYQQKVIDIDDKITDSCVKLYLNPQKCSWKSLGRLTDLKAIAQSSNYFQFITALKVAGQTYRPNMRFNPSPTVFKTYRDMYAAYGLGVKTGIDLPNEKIGVIGQATAGDLLLNLTIGQYDTYTPIQLWQYINTIALKGIKQQPHLAVKAGKKISEVPLDNMYRERVIEAFRQVMTVGTGRRYAPLKYNAGGKTGTSESFLDSDLDGKVDINTITTSFALFAPIDKPTLSMALIAPHISHKMKNNTSIYNINRRITQEFIKKVFENA